MSDTTMATRLDQRVFEDSDVERNRFGRWCVLLLSLAILLGLPTFVFWLIAVAWFDYGPIGFFGGVFFGIYLLSLLLSRYIIVVSATRAFLTTNLLAGWIRLRGEVGEGNQGNRRNRKTLVTYGPGLSISYPWEDRVAINNVSLEVVSETFDIAIQTKTGTIQLKGSFRIQADITKLDKFINLDVSTLKAGIIDLVQSKAIDMLAPMTLDEALSNGVGKLNGTLSGAFRDSRTPDGTEDLRPIIENFQDIFGILVLDITASEILPSTEAQKTRTALDEAMVIVKGTANLMGYQDDVEVRDGVQHVTKSAVEKMNEDLRDGRITDRQIDETRDRFLAASDNIDMNLQAFEIRGLEGFEGLLKLFMNKKKGKGRKKGGRNG